MRDFVEKLQVVGMLLGLAGGISIPGCRIKDKTAGLGSRLVITVEDIESCGFASEDVGELSLNLRYFTSLTRFLLFVEGL